jgi:hypothetical protein
MATKYIVNNVSEQTITGDLKINGNIIVTGSTTSNSIGTYKALLSQTGSITGTSINNFGGQLIIGETYTITNYQTGDTFTNVADVISGNINETGGVFIATADVPSYWGEGSELVSGGDIVSRVLENTLGFDIDWVHDDTGYYVGYRSDIPFTYFNEFPRNDIYTNAQSVYPFDYFGCPFSPLLTIGVGYDYLPNDSLYLAVTDVCAGPGPAYVDNLLYFTPIQIQFKKEYLEVYGAIYASFPFNYVSLALFCDGNFVEPIFADDISYVNNISEMLTLLNNDTQTKSFDISFSEGGPGGLIMRMSKDIKNLYCEGELQFLIYSDI